MQIHNFEQRTPEWYDIRRGKVTASNLSKVLSKSSPRSTYLYEKAAEILSDAKEDNYTNDYMQWGIDTEAQAKAYYELTNGVNIDEVGFVSISDYVGCSPDGLVGDNGLIEVKCPKTSTHIKYMNDGKLPSTYKAQVQGQIWMCERDWCDFVSFDPRVSNKVFCIRVERDDEYISILEKETSKFVDDLKNIINRCQ